MTELFDTVLVANRGEIAVRIIRTLHRLGIRAVAVYAPDDAGALHVREADDAVALGDADHATAADTYLNIEAIVAACRSTGAQAVHPGYGFLSENLNFARALEAAGITFIGPPSESINLMGDKIRSKNHVKSHGVPVVPGIAEPGLSDAELIEAAEGVGYPLLIKPSAGGGGKGMFAVNDAGELPDALASARRTAASAFGDDTLFLERLVTTPRHIEVQVLADEHGRTVHLGERECSLQRRHQKVIEEAPAPLLEGLGEKGERIRADLGAAAVRAAESVGYRGAGTVEFLVSDDAPDEFFFMEMNTRLQVEHPVTEEVVRIDGQPIDLVEQQVRIAAGQPIAFAQDDVVLTGHAVEARVYAEDPAADFLPSAGKAFHVELPTGEGVRVDTAIKGAGTISAGFDPMIAKVIAHSADRTEALARLDGALADTALLGVATNVEYLRSLIADDDVAAGRLDTNLIARRGAFAARELTSQELHFAAAALESVDQHGRQVSVDAPRGPWHSGDGWRLGEHRRRTYYLDVDGHTVPVAAGDGGEFWMSRSNGQARLSDPDGGANVQLVWDAESGSAWLASGGRTANVRLLSRREKLHRELAQLEREVAGGDPHLRAPMPGTVVSLGAATGDRVEAGQPIVTVEAMKMEHPAIAAISGVVTVHVAVGDQVPKDHILASVEPDAADPTSEGA